MNVQYHDRQTGRMGYVDLLRAYGIVLMIMGHIGFGGVFDKYIHAFHMPLFFVISGFFYKPCSLPVIMKKRFRTLLVPYIVFGIFYTALWFLKIGRVDRRLLYIFLWENTADGGPAIAGALWFLTALFFCEVLYHLIQKIDRELIRTMLIVLVSAAGMAWAGYLQFRLPYGLEAAMVGVGLFHGGRLLREKFSILTKLPFFVSILVFAVFSVLSMKNGYINLRVGAYGNWALFWLNALGMTISLLNLARFIDHFTGPGILGGYLNGIGKNSIIYLCFNQWAILETRSVLNRVSGGSVLPGINWIILILVMAELFILQKLICNTRLKILVGRD